MQNIVLINTVPMIIEGINKALKTAFPDVKVKNIMDDHILELIKNNRLSAVKRLEKIVELAEEGGSCVVITCSSLSEIADKIPAKHLLIDEPMLKEAGSYKRILVAVTAETSIGPTTAGILKHAEKQDIKITPLFIPEAIAKYKEGLKEEHDRIVLETLKRELAEKEYDAVVLAQVSMAHLKKDLQKETEVKILSSVDSFIEFLIKTYREE